MSLIFFLLISGSNSSSVDVSAEVKGFNDAFWNRFFDSWLPKLFFFLLPLFALIIAWLYRKQQRGMMPHFLFALHFHSSLFFMGNIYAVVSYIFRKLEWLIVNEVFLGLCGLYLAFYLWKSLRKMYSESRLKTSWKYIVLVVLYATLLVVSTFVLLLFSYNY